ncbi:MAG: hypothetical protein WAO28_00710 [Candidatus Microsaccharimonas sp.]
MEYLILATLLVIAAETTYLVATHTTKITRSKKQYPIFVDTSVLIDGRILAIAESGFITSTLQIPRSVVGELQYLADNADSDKRMRARHGLDVVSELQAMPQVHAEIFNDGTKAEEGVDNRLLKLAKQYNGSICTIDFNLNKVAQVEGIKVLNVNDLAKTLRMAYLPGEKILLELTQKGNDQHQAVGHLVDGTMVVVEHAHQFIGKSVEIEFIRSLQTAAGKMMFARVAGNQKPASKAPEARNPQPKGRQPQIATEPSTQPEKKPQASRNNNRRAQPSQVQAQPAEQAPVQPQAPSTTRPQTNARRQGRPAQNSNRRRNNEDSLIELANKQ